MTDILVILGTTLNLVGSLVIAFSVKENDVGANVNLENGKSYPVTYISKKEFRIGIGLLIFGFLFQLLGLVRISLWDFWSVLKTFC